MSEHAKPSGARLGEDEIGHYHERGYLVPGYRLPEDLASELRAACDRLIAADPDTRPEHLMNPHLVPWPDARNPFMQVAGHAAILDIVAQLIGPDLILWITRILCKPAGDGQEVPWHQDGHYWPIRPRDPQCHQCSGLRSLRPAAHADARRGSIGQERFQPRSRHVGGAPGEAWR